jgi:hypothetical protein
VWIGTRRSEGRTQGRSNRREPPRVVPVGFCLAPFAPTFYHSLPLPPTSFHPLPPGGQTAQKSSVQPGFTSVPSSRQGFPLDTSGTRRIPCPVGSEIYRVNNPTRPMRTILLLLSLITLSLTGISLGEVPTPKCKCHCDKDPKCTCTKGECKCHKAL